MSLCLTRKIGERVHIGKEIVVTVTRVQGNRCTLAFDAPQHYDIRRHELDSDEPGDVREEAA